MWRWLLVAVALVMSACGGQGNSAPATAVSTPIPAASAAATTVPSPSRAPAIPTATAAAKATNTPSAAASNAVWVGNTDGEGVYVRKTPTMDDRLRAYPDGTELTVIGDDAEGDAQQWKHIRTPDGVEGYVPATYTTTEPPS